MGTATAGASAGMGEGSSTESSTCCSQTGLGDGLYSQSLALAEEYWALICPEILPHGPDI